MDITEWENLERKATEYEKLNKMKGNLISTVSHELRTPLATIKGFATMILDYFPMLSTDEKHNYVKYTDISSDRLTELVEGLLETSRLESGLLKLRKTPMGITELIKDITGENRVKTNRHAFTVDLAKRPPLIFIDAKRLHQVSDNIIDNAVKHSRHGTEVLISGIRYGRELVIGVTGHCPGIPTDELTRIFDRMFQVEENLYSGREVIGLGLYVCRRSVEVHGGRIWVESTPGKGNTVRFTPAIPHIIKWKSKKRVTESTSELYFIYVYIFHLKERCCYAS